MPTRLYVVHYGRFLITIYVKNVYKYLLSPVGGWMGGQILVLKLILNIKEIPVKKKGKL